MASIRKAIAVAVAALLLVAVAAEAGLMSRNAEVVRGLIASYDSGTGRLVVGTHTLYVTPQTQLHKRVRDRYEPLAASSLAPGQEVRAVGVWTGSRCLVRSVDVLEKTYVPSQAK